MNREIRKILERHKGGEITTNKAVNEILVLSVLKKNDVLICEMCDEHLLINGVCPSCTIEFCTPLDGPIVL